MRITVLVALMVAPAQAWEARCFRDDGERCSEADAGPKTARFHWRGEHYVMLRDTLTDHGFPGELLVPRDVVFYGDNRDVPGDAAASSWRFDSFRDISSRDVRSVEVARFAELPDFSLSLEDFLTGNETCPLEGTGPDPQDCHVYAVDFSGLSLGVVAPVNSTHFSPQSGRLFEHYIGLGRAVAAQCRALQEGLGDSWRSERYLPYLQDCDWSALAIAGVGIHFLQDTWSSGHMWHRWGGPQLEHVGGQVTGGLVGAIAGILHGAKSLVPFADDPMCYPIHGRNVRGERTEWRIGDGPPTPGLGDIYSGYFADEPDTYGAVQEAIFDCTAAALGSVYNAGARSFSDGVDWNGGGLAYEADDPRCVAPRATNQSMAAGMGLDIGGINIPLEPAVAALVTFGGRFAPVFGALANGFREDLVALSLKVNSGALFEPNGTGAARNDGVFAIGSFLGVAPNEQHLGDVPAAYHDHAPPYDQEHPMARVFLKGNVSTWCTELDGFELSQVAAECQDTGDAVGPACHLCRELADMVFLDGCDPAVDAFREDSGVCARLHRADPSVVDWLPLPGEGTPAERIDAWCQGDAAASACFNDRFLLVDRTGGRLLQLTTNEAIADDANFVIPVGERPERVAVGPALVAVVSNGVGDSVSLVDITAQRELDTDEDPETTDEGAPDGVTRIPVPGPRGIAMTRSGRYAFVASYTAGVMTVIDVMRRRIHALLPMPDDHADSVAINGAETKIYVSLTGTIREPDNRIVVFDLQRAIDGVDGNDGSIGLIDHVGGGARLTRLVLAPDDSTLGVVMPGVERVGLIDTETDTVIDLTPEPNTRFVRMDYPPTGLAFHPATSALYITEVDSEGAGGSVREVAFGETRLGEAIPVGLSPRAIAVTADGARAYVANGDNTISVIDLATGLVSTLDLADFFLQARPSDVVVY